MLQNQAIEAPAVPIAPPESFYCTEYIPLEEFGNGAAQVECETEFPSAICPAPSRQEYIGDWA